MAYQALYRQWRPGAFAQMVGQEAVVATLRRQVTTGRISHAYLFSGTRGTGKTTTAQIFSRAINCLDPQDGDPCGVCQSCVSIAEGTTLDVEEIDAASNNGVDEIRQLRERIQYPPQNGKFRVFIIDEVHMLSPSAFNALLKTLEEPPAHAVMILATTEPQRLPATILSRCQRFDFKRIPAVQIAGRLREVVEAASVAYEEDALMALARAAEGGLRDGLSLLDHCMALGGSVTAQAVDEVTGSAGRAFLTDLTAALAMGNLGEALTLIDRAMRDGRDAAVLSRDLAAHVRGLMVLMAAGEQAGRDILEISAEEAALQLAQAQQLGRERALRAVDILARVEPEMRWAAHPRTLLELAAARICRPEGEEDLAALRARVEALEARGVAVPVATPAAAPATPAPVATPIQKEERPPVAVPMATPAPGGKDNQAIWQGTLAGIKKTNISLYTALRRARLASLQGGSARVVFQPDDEVFCKMMQMEDKLAILRAALTQSAGESIAAVVEISGQNAPPEPEPEPGKQPWVQDAIDFFGRENVDLLEKGGN